jgi:hypothetical protein
MDAAWQLGNRIDNIRHQRFLAYLAEGSGREQDAKLTTLFRFAQYFGWREFIRAEVHLLRFEDENDTRLVSRFLNDVGWIFSSDSLDRGRAMLWADEQRGIGELMANDRAELSPCEDTLRSIAPTRSCSHPGSNGSPETCCHRKP